MTRYEWRAAVLARYGADPVFAVAFALTEHGDHDLTNVRPGQERLAAILSTTDRAVRRHLARLRDDGFLSWKQAGAIRSPTYLFAIPARTETSARTNVSARLETSARTNLVASPDVLGIPARTETSGNPVKEPGLDPAGIGILSGTPDASTVPPTPNPNPESVSNPEPTPAEVKRRYEAALNDGAKAVLAHLNARTGRAYKAAAGTLAPIVARLRDGATVAECRAVVDGRVAKWGADPKMAEYLRPSTLFRPSHFDEYLAAARPAVAAAPAAVTWQRVSTRISCPLCGTSYDRNDTEADYNHRESCRSRAAARGA